MDKLVMKRNSLSSILAQITVCYLMVESFVVASAGGDPMIRVAPSENVVVPQGQTTLVNFNCIAEGTVVLWIINGTLVHHNDQNRYQESGIMFYPDSSVQSGTNISIGINVTTARNNNTELSCFVNQYDSSTQMTRNSTSPAITLTIAGPPFAPHPRFHVVNATHIQVQWDKPFALSDFDVRQYILIVNTTSVNDSTRNETFYVSANTTYPITYYISNDGDIPKECVYINFLLAAINDAGKSNAGSAIGGFPIAPSPIPNDSLRHEVTFTSNFIPTLHINFTFPKVCDYHDAKFSIQILGEDRLLMYQSMEETYDKDSPDNVEVTISKNLQKDSSYTAIINVSTAVNWTMTQLKFDTFVTPKRGGIEGTNAAADNRYTTVIISSSIASGLCAFLLGLIIVMMVAVVMRRRKFTQRNRAHQRELETDEAVQRAAQAMVPNPIYSGNPIYEEIVDSSMLKSLRNGVGVSETTSRDEGYVAISADTVKNVSWFPLPEESKLVEDKYATFPEDTYTVMNPAGTLSHQSKGPAYEEPLMHHSSHHGNSIFQEQNRSLETNTAITNNEHCAAAAGSAPVAVGFSTQDEERYVKGAF